MEIVNIHKSIAELSKLIEKTLKGKGVIITRSGKSVVRYLINPLERVAN